MKSYDRLSLEEELCYALAEARRRELREVLDTDPSLLPQPPFSPRYLRRREKLLRSPFRSARPRWERLLQTAACLLVALSLAATAIWNSPTARAWGARFGFAQFGDRNEYSFFGKADECLPDQIPEPMYLPDGFLKAKETRFYSWVETIYENPSTGETIVYLYQKAKEGSSIGFDSEHATLREIEIGNYWGHLYQAISPAYDNRLALFDANEEYLLLFESKIDSLELIKMAESVDAP